MDHGPAPREWQLTADQIWISNLDDLFLRPSIRLPAEPIFIISDPATTVPIKRFRSIFQQEHDGWTDRSLREMF